jgi:hypothetical protein
MLFGALSVGILCGIIPFKLGKKHNKEGWGLAGLITSIIGGLSLGIILALTLAGVFSAIILVSIDN